MRDRIRSIRSGALAILLACCACLVLAGPALAAETNTYIEGTGSRGFSIDRWDQGWSWDQGAADETLTLTLDGLPGLSAPAITSTEIAGVFELGGQPVGKVGFIKFRLVVDIAVDAAFDPLPVVSYTSRPDGSDFHDANVSSWAPGSSSSRSCRGAATASNPAGACSPTRSRSRCRAGAPPGRSRSTTSPWSTGSTSSRRKTTGTVAAVTATTTTTVTETADKDKPSGVAYMGGSDGDSGTGSGGSGTGSGGSGTGSGQGGGNSAGVRVGEGTGSIDTEAPVTASPRSTAGDTVTGYPLRLEDVLAGGEGGGGSGDGSGGSPGVGRRGGGFVLSCRPHVARRRRWRSRRRSPPPTSTGGACDGVCTGLVEQTPDGPAPRVTAPA